MHHDVDPDSAGAPAAALGDERIAVIAVSALVDGRVTETACTSVTVWLWPSALAKSVSCVLWRATPIRSHRKPSLNTMDWDVPPMAEDVISGLSSATG
jgi:hypothetical protein